MGKLPSLLVSATKAEMNFRQLAYGILSYLPLPSDWLMPRTGGTESAEYCYSVWLRHLVLASAGGMHSFPGSVAELGPGDSLGVGMAALISGAERYFAFDAFPHADRRNDLEIFDNLVDMFRSRRSVPGLSVFPEMVIDLPSYDFPSHLLNEVHLEKALAPVRIAALREQLSNSDGRQDVIVYRAPWQHPATEERASVDFLISNAVLEHVEDIAATYRAISEWLRPGGWSTHQIDFRSHSLLTGWDGHWACPDWLWKLMQGRRAYLLNRQPFSIHLQTIREAGLKVLHSVRCEREPERTKIASQFRHLSLDDRRTSVAFILIGKL